MEVTIMDRFEMYLNKKHKFITSMIEVLKNNNNSAVQAEVTFLEAQLEILDDIIHHFSIFVKVAEDV